jgi:hypothetical protein
VEKRFDKPAAVNQSSRSADSIERRETFLGSSAL